MNERIKQLAIEAGFPSWSNHAIEIELEKFAELIMEEACLAFWSEACYVSDLAYEEYSRNSKKIKQHFGVNK